ncbi:MAG: DUF5058 family protein [Ignavibacteriales bacterium]
MEYLNIANGFLMWLTCGICVALVLVQSLIFVRKSLADGAKLGISNEQVSKAMRSAAISSIGPSMAIVVGIIPLLVSMGGPVSWMRLSVIGSVAYELMAAGFGASAMGVTLAGKDMNAVAFANGVWVMSLGSAGWLLFTAFFTHRMESFRSVLAGGRKALIPIVSASAMLGAFAYLDADRLMPFGKGSWACIVGFVVMAVLISYARKNNVKFLKEWSLTISMVAGMLVAAMIP